MDLIDPGFRYPLELRIETDPTNQLQTSPSVTSSQRISRRSTSRPDSAASTNTSRKGVIQTHWENMEALRDRKTVHLSRSLDHYCHQRVSSEELQKRVEDQVLTRFMERQISTDRETSPTAVKAEYLKLLRELCSNAVRKVQPSSLRPRDSIRPEAAMEEGQEGGASTAEATRHTRTLDHAAQDTRGDHLPAQILVVPQLWLWKFDSECKCNTYQMIDFNLCLPVDLVITSYPERWDCAYKRDSLLDAIRKSVEYLNVDAEVQPDRLVAEILNACAEFQATVDIGEQSFKWTDAFDDEILFVVSRTSPGLHYNQSRMCVFRNSLVNVMAPNGLQYDSSPGVSRIATLSSKTISRQENPTKDSLQHSLTRQSTSGPSTTYWMS